MMSNMDILAFLVSMIIAIIITIWIASGNNKVGDYGVGENDPPETSRPLLPGEGTRTVNCSPPEGSKPPEPKNQYTIKTLLTPESRTRIRESIEKERLFCKCVEPTYEAPQIPKKIPMLEVKPPSAPGESKNEEEIEMTICDRLKEILRKRPFFNCVGGCGVDLSEGQDDCMSSEGVWFKYCPFCGKKIINRRKENGSWEWFEE